MQSIRFGIVGSPLGSLLSVPCDLLPVSSPILNF